MSMIAKNEGGTEIEKLEDGVYTAISSMLVDLGIQNNEKFGKKQRKFIIVWNIVGEFIELNGEQRPRVISKEYTMSLSEKSTLRKDLQAWRGKTFTAEELEGFLLNNILNVPCQLQILNEEKNGKTYTNIASIMAMPKGMTVEKLDKTVVFDTYEPETWKTFREIPKWIQEKIRKCENKAETGLDIYIKEYDEIMANTTTETPDDVITGGEIPADDLPF